MRTNAADHARAPLLEEADKLLACVHCGFCLTACPTYTRVGHEGDSPRGRLDLMRAVVEGRLEPDDAGFSHHIDRCLGCRACETACPAGVEYGPLLERARTSIARAKGHRFTTRALLATWGERLPSRIAGTLGRRLLANAFAARLAPRLPASWSLPRFGLAMMASTRPWPGLRESGQHADAAGSTRGRGAPEAPRAPSTPGAPGETASERLRRLEEDAPVLEEREVAEHPALEPEVLEAGAQAQARARAQARAQAPAAPASPTPPYGPRRVPPRIESSSESGAMPWRAGTPALRVAMLTGCVQGSLLARTNEATLRVLVANGATLVDAPEQHCCGALHAHSGELEGARSRARRNIAAFEAAAIDVVVTNAAGCGAMLKEYGDLLSHDTAWAERAAAFSARARDIWELLAELGPRPGAPLAMRAAYDAPCHLYHAQRITTLPLDVLRGVPSLEAVPIPDYEECCGGAGLYGIQHRELGGRILQDKLAAIRSVQPDVVVTPNPGCHMQIGAGLVLAGDDLPVVHPIELLDESYRRAGYYDE